MSSSGKKSKAPGWSDERVSAFERAVAEWAREREQVGEWSKLGAQAARVFYGVDRVLSEIARAQAEQKSGHVDAFAFHLDRAEALFNARLIRVSTVAQTIRQAHKSMQSAHLRADARKVAAKKTREDRLDARDLAIVAFAEKERDIKKHGYLKRTAAAFHLSAEAIKKILMKN